MSTRRAMGCFAVLAGALFFAAAIVPTLAAASDNKLSQLGCAAGEIAKFDGANWVCAEDVDTDTNAETICDEGKVLLGDGSCAGANFLLPQGCASGQVAKSNGTIWICAEDVDTDTDTDTNAATECGAGEVLLGDGSCLDASALIPPTERFVDNGDGTVTDNETGLTWEQKLAKEHTGCAAEAQAERNVRCVDNMYSWTDVADGDSTNPDGLVFRDFLATVNQEIAAELYSTCFAGHCDWRVPREVELRSILLGPFPCSTSPCIHPIFGPTAADCYWSSTSYANDGVFAWFVNFDNGYSHYGNHKTNDCAVRAVRGGS